MPARRSHDETEDCKCRVPIKSSPLSLPLTASLVMSIAALLITKYQLCPAEGQQKKFGGVKMAAGSSRRVERKDQMSICRYDPWMKLRIARSRVPIIKSPPRSLSPPHGLRLDSRQPCGEGASLLRCRRQTPVLASLGIFRSS